MLSERIARFFRRNRPPAPPEPDRVAVRLEGNPPSALPEGKMACVFRGTTFVNVYRDKPPQAVRGDETCWLLPSEDLPLDIALESGASTVAARTFLRFEPESLGELLASRNVLFADDLAALVTSELGGLLDLLGQHDTDDLVGLDDEGRERLRAKLSLLLSARGFRCTAVENLRDAQAGQEPAGIAPAATCSDTVRAGAPAEPDQVDRELAAAIRGVKSDAAWDTLMGSLEQAGLESDENAAAELDDLGDKLVDGQLDADQVARRIRVLAEQASQRAGVPPRDLRRWQGLALRLRLSDVSPEPPDHHPDAAPAAAAKGLDASRRPWTWWMLRRRSVDERLRQFLENAARQSRVTLGGYRHGLDDLRHAAQVRDMEQRLQVVEELLATVPTLTPPYHKLRPDRQRVKDLVRNVEQAVTAAEMVQAQVRVVLEQSPGSAAWQAAIVQNRAALETLTDQLRARRAIR